MYSRVLATKKDYTGTYLGEPIINLLDTTFQIPIDYSADIMEVTEEYVARPDLLAIDIYGDVLYTDILCKVNGISNPFELQEGMYIIAPGFDALEDFIVEPSWSEEATILPVSKTKTETRKPSDATQGNERFVKDDLNKVLIY